MDYLKIYNHFYEKAFNVVKRIIISEFKKAKAKNRPFHKIGNDIGRDLRKYRIEKFEKVLKDKAAKAFSVFINKHDYVSGEQQDVIRQILEEEVLNAFDNSKLYPFTHFIADLAIVDSLKEVERHYQIYHSYYKMIYELNQYDYFYLKDFKGISYESSKEYKEMLDIKYPYLIEERKVSEVALDLAQNEQKDKNAKKKGVKIRSQPSYKEESVLEIVNTFDDNERALLIFLFNEQKKKNNLSEMHLTELIKLFKIVGMYTELSVFVKTANDSTFYKMTNNGLEYYSSKKSRQKLVDSTLRKLEKFNMNFMMNLIKSKKIDLL